MTLTTQLSHRFSTQILATQSPGNRLSTPAQLKVLSADSILQSMTKPALTAMTVGNIEARNDEGRDNAGDVNIFAIHLGKSYQSFKYRFQM